MAPASGTGTGTALQQGRSYVRENISARFARHDLYCRRSSQQNRIAMQCRNAVCTVILVREAKSLNQRGFQGAGWPTPLPALGAGSGVEDQHLARNTTSLYYFCNVSLAPDVLYVS